MNRQVILVARPVGVAQAEHFVIREVSPAPLGPGQLLFKTSC